MPRSLGSRPLLFCAAIVLTLGGFAARVAAQAPPPGDADLIVRNARIWTGDSARPRAQALAVRGERLLAVGTDAEIDAFRSPHTRVIDAGGRFVTPGFIDDHTHFAQAGALLIGANLLDVSTPGPFAARVKAAAARMSPGAWLTGGDWGAYEKVLPGESSSKRPASAVISPTLGFVRSLIFANQSK